MPRLSVRLLGPFSGDLDGRPLRGFRSNKVRALLAYLMVEAHRPWSRASLAALLWPELSETSAQSNLRNALANLRRVLDDRGTADRFVLVTESTLQFNRKSDAWLDLWALLKHGSPTATAGQVSSEGREIRQLEVALAAYRGEFLEGFSVASAPFEEWLVVTREQALQSLLLLLRRLALMHEQRAELEAASGYARRYLELEPWDEAAYRFLMQLLAAQGKRSAALRLYDECRLRLTRDLGIKPEQATVQLCEQIRGGETDTSMAPASPAVSWTLEEAPAPGRSPAFLTAEDTSADVAPPFFARHRELGLLEKAMREVIDGRGQVRFVTGEPGSGKTALLAEFSRRAMTAYPDVLVAWGQCSAFSGEGSPYLPFVSVLRMLGGEVDLPVSAGVITTGHARRLWRCLPDSLEVLLEYGPDLIGSLLSGSDLLAVARLSTGVRAESLGRLRRRVSAAAGPPARSRVSEAVLFEQLTSVLCNLARSHPLILVLDDLQWADPASIDLVFHLARQAAGSRVLILGAYRGEEVAARRNAQPHALQGVVHELSAIRDDIAIDLMQSEGMEFVEELVQSEPNDLGQGFRDNLYRHTSGNPLFAIELLRGMQLRGDLVRNRLGRWVASRDLDWHELPGRVESVIAGRIDHLTIECQELLSVACVEGEQFTAQVLAGVLGTDLQHVGALLSQELGRQHRLVADMGPRQVGGQSLSIYRFCHSLFQIYLYDRLDPAERARLHGQVAAVLEQHYREDQARLSELAHVLARHFEMAGRAQKAAQYHTLAGRHALELSANRAAVDHFQRALAALQSLPSSEQHDWQALDLHLSMGPPITATRGWGAPELEENYRQAEALCYRLADDVRLVPALWLLSVYRLGRAEHAAVDRLVERFYGLAQSTGDPDLLCLANLQVSPLYQGRLIEAREILLRAGQARDVAQQRRLAYRYGMSPAVVALAYLSHCEWLLGDTQGSILAGQQALDLAEAVDVPIASCYALGRASWQRAFAGQPEAAAQYAERQLQITVQREFRSFELGARFLLAWAEAQSGAPAEASLEAMHQIMQTYQDMGTVLNRTTFLILFAGACERAGQPERGLAALDEAIAVGQSTGERWFEAEAYRLKGELLLQAGRGDATLAEARHCLNTAREVALEQGARMLQARADASLLRLHE